MPVGSNDDGRIEFESATKYQPLSAESTRERGGYVRLTTPPSSHVAFFDSLLAYHERLIPPQCIHLPIGLFNT